MRDSRRLKLIDIGVGLDPDFLAFNLRKERAKDPRASWLQTREFRRAVSAGVDRTAIVNAVYLGAADPIYGPISPGNRTWHDASASKGSFDPAEARRLLATAGLTDANGDGQLEDAHGKPARFSILTQGGHNRERVSAVIQEQLRKLGLAVDIVTLDPGGLVPAVGKGRLGCDVLRPAVQFDRPLAQHTSSGSAPARSTSGTRRSPRRPLTGNGASIR